MLLFQQTELLTEYIFDANNGTAVGGYGTILKTTNGGQTWNTQTSGTTYNLLQIQFTDTNNGVIIGTYGLFLRTTDGGQNWISQIIDHQMNLMIYLLYRCKSWILVGWSRVEL